MMAFTRYPYLPIFPRIRGVVILDEERNVLYSHPKRDTLDNLMPGLLHASTAISNVINSGKAYDITTGKLRVYTIEEEDPFPFFTAVVVNKEASKQVGMWTMYLSKFVSILLSSHQITEASNEARRILEEDLSKEIESMKVPDKGEVLRYISNAYDLIEHKDTLVSSLLKDLKAEENKEVEKTQAFLSKASEVSECSLEDILDLIDQGKICQAFLSTENQHGDEKFQLLWVTLGLLLKNLHYETPAPSLTALETQLQHIQSKEYPSLTRLVQFCIKKLKSVQHAREVYGFLKEDIRDVLSNLSYERNAYKRSILSLALCSLISIFFPIEKETLILLTNEDKLKKIIPVDLWWAHATQSDNLYNPLLPHFLMRAFNWQELKPFLHTLLEKSEKTKETFACSSEKLGKSRLLCNNLQLHTIWATFSFFAISVVNSYSLNLSDKEKVTEIYQSKLEALLNHKKETLAWNIPLAHLGISVIHANRYTLNASKSSFKKWKDHGRKAIREVIKLNKRNRIGDFPTLVILLIALDVLHLKVENGRKPSPEVVLALQRILHLNEEAISFLEEVTSPYYLRRVLLTTGLTLLLNNKTTESEHLIRQGRAMLGRFLPRMMTRGVFTWNLLAMLFHVEKRSPPERKLVQYGRKALDAIFLENAWKAYGWQAWASNFLVIPLEKLLSELSIK